MKSFDSRNLVMGGLIGLFVYLLTKNRSSGYNGCCGLA